MPVFVPVMAAGDLSPGRGVAVEAAGRTIALFNVGGAFYALDGRCPHRGGPLGEGFLDGREVSCPWHNYAFDVTTGENVVSADLKVARYEVKVEDGQICVNLE